MTGFRSISAKCAAQPQAKGTRIPSTVSSPSNDFLFLVAISLSILSEARYKLGTIVKEGHVARLPQWTAL